MGKKRFKGWTKGWSHSTEVGRYDSMGMSAGAQGWDLGVRVEASSNADLDVFEVYVNGGSNNDSKKRLVFTVQESPDYIEIEYPNGDRQLLDRQLNPVLV